MKGGVHFSIDINPMPCIYLFNIDFEFDFLSHTSHTHLEFNLNIYAEILDFLLIVDIFFQDTGFPKKDAVSQHWTMFMIYF